MQEDIQVDAVPSPSGGLIQIQAGAVDLTSWLGPTWATLCGVMASNAFNWRGGDWLRLALLALLVDAGWGTLWTALAGTNWALAIGRWRRWDKNRATTKLPFTLPGAPGDRISHWIGRLRAWWQEVVWPTCGPAIKAVLVASPLTALLGAVLGPELLLLSLGALALMQLGVIWERGHGSVPPGWDASIAVALPWLAGHAAFGSVTLPSLALATLFTVAWGSAWNPTSGWARAALVASQLGSAGCLVVLRRPLAAGALLLLLVPQVALLPWTRRQLPAARFVRYVRPWIATALAVGAFVL